MLPKHSSRLIFSRSFTRVGPSTQRRTDEPASKYRSKHYNPTSTSNDSKPTEKIHLEPHILSRRLIKLCDDRRLDVAVAMLKNSPLDAQNVPVWNTLIWECLKAERYRLGHDLYIDMKRRGHRPNTRTFQTLMNGLSRIEDWDSHTKQLAHSHSIYELSGHDPSSAELSVAPIAAYVKILGSAGLHQQIFDVFYSLDTEGRLAPDRFLFTAMFQALAVKPYTDSDNFVQNAASAKLLWNLMLKASRRTNFSIDGFLVSSAIIALSRGRDADQEFALGLVAEHFGLVAFDAVDEPASPKKEEKGSIPLEPQSFAAVLTLCRNSAKPIHAINFFAAVLKRPESQGGPSIIDRAHVEQVLQSFLAAEIPASSQKALELVEWMLAQEIKSSSSVAAKIRPTHSTFNLIISQICRAENDWRVAAKVFDLMTGYHSHDFMDGVEATKPRFDRRSPGRNIPPTAEVLSSMMRIAVGSESRANIRQALRLIHYFGFRSLIQPPDTLESKKAMKDKAFYISKLAQAVLAGIKDCVQPEHSERETTCKRSWAMAVTSVRRAKSFGF
ncbi:hypothetical protein BT96DRAFT_961898 [Gymnopus androsaceus JB14]|uniref:Pentatricopeptide repeat-containing protein n=1 Tax=Gymnopus androsaceus JB14 TaxID=1447944 RepID=A0A6A4IQY9_9AGAR|nr:hypothetical protein BT96DRAFT_961898 [Gymnopus androsaceus JB14]